MSVSDKDRTAAIEAVASELGKDRGYSCLDFPDAASDAVTAVIALGWEPRPTATEEPQIVMINGRKFEVEEWSWKDWDEGDNKVHRWELWAREVSSVETDAIATTEPQPVCKCALCRHHDHPDQPLRP